MNPHRFGNLFPYVFLTAFVFSAASGLLRADDAESSVPLHISGLESPVLMLADAETGEIVLERNGQRVLSPASLTKLMTLHLSLTDAESGALGENTVYPIPQGGDAASMRWGSSVLGLKEGDEATLLTLQRAAAIVSANDAAWSLALLSSSNPNDFIGRMNTRARSLGMSETRYVDPDGWSSLNETTAKDQITLSIAYLKAHAGILETLHSHQEMIYSDKDHLHEYPNKRNTNLLIGKYPGLDGLKTGTIPNTGFHFIATAERDGTRFLALVMGLQATEYREGLNKRAEEAAFLLDWGFRSFFTWRPDYPDIPELIVKHGSHDRISLILEHAPIPMTLGLSGGTIEVVIDTAESLIAPVEEGQDAGTVSWIRDGKILQERRLITTTSVRRRWRLRDFLGLGNPRF